MEILILILKCILIGVIWAAILLPAFSRNNSAVRYAITVLVIAVVCYVLCYIVGGYADLINRTTLIALVALVLSWILSGAVFEKESRMKSKVIAFTCVIAGLSYIVSHLIGSVINIV